MPSTLFHFRVCEIELLEHADLVDACTISAFGRFTHEKKIWFDSFDTDDFEIQRRAVVSDFDSTISCAISVECIHCHQTEVQRFELKGYRLLTPVVGLKLGGRSVYCLDDSLYDDYYVACKDCLADSDCSCSVHSHCDSDCEYRSISFGLDGERSPPTAEELYAAREQAETSGSRPDLDQASTLTITVESEGEPTEVSIYTGTLAQIIAQLEELARD